MEIKKVANLGQTEVELLVNSGKLLREVSNGLADGTIDELGTESMNLLNAEIKAYKDTKITEAQSLKIIIPDSLKSIYNQLSNMGKE